MERNSDLSDLLVISLQRATRRVRAVRLSAWVRGFKIETIPGETRWQPNRK